MSYLKESIAKTVWEQKYCYQGHDQTVEDTWQRVAKAAAKAESAKDRKAWQARFYSLLENFQFLPGGRILAGAGTHHKVTLFNCFVMNIPEDSLDGIFTGLKEGALTLQQGGGVGYDFSRLRPRGQIVAKTGVGSSGPVSFMRVWDTMCSVLLSTGARRGAMMGVLRCDHPDIEEFITAKKNPTELRHFNVSVLVSDAFMQAVNDNRQWELVFPLAENEAAADVVQRCWDSREPVACRVVKRIDARALWQQIIKSAYDYAEPGVIFADTINRQNTLWYHEWISATNPCGEIPLPTYGACNLGSINLTQFVHHPFTDKAELDWQGIEKTVQIATRFLDNIIDVSHYPLPVQKREAHATRRIGLGLTGLGDIFVMLGMRYGSAESVKLAEAIMQTIAYTTWKSSAELAKEKGSFPLFDAQQYLQGEFVKRLPDDIRALIKAHGMRNSHHNTIAPTGTISLLANNVSNGLEPIFAPSYERFVRSPEGDRDKFTVTDYAVRLWQDQHPGEALPPAWSDSQTLTPDDHLQIQRVMQPYIDNAISKTINLPEDFPFEKLNDVYSQAYQYGLKGCTIFRPNPITGNVLQTAKHDNEEVDRCCRE